METVSGVLFRVFAEAMGCSEDRLHAYTDKHVSSLNLFSSRTGSGGGIAQVHGMPTCTRRLRDDFLLRPYAPVAGDADSFTILSHDHSSGSIGTTCLEFQAQSGGWECVPRYKEDVLLVNLGQIMERWSGISAVAGLLCVLA